MKFPYLSGLVAGGLIVGGAVLLASPNRINDTETNPNDFNENLQARVDILKKEAEDLIELGKSITEEVKKYLDEKIPSLIGRIEELNLDIKIRCAEMKDILLDLVDRLWTLFEKTAYSFSQR